MNCPVCTDVNLAIAERRGIEIDYCPSCRGVWLDRGELDRIIEAVERDAPAPVPVGDDRDDRYDRDDRGRDDRGDSPRRGRRKKESLLADFFDFG